MPPPLAVLGLGLISAGIALLDFSWRRSRGVGALH